MKHSGGSTADLPPLPPEYEWVRDASEKSNDAWIAVKKKLTRDVVEAMRRNIGQLQDAVFSRKVDIIRDTIERAKAQNQDGVGPCAKAIKQAEEYVEKLDEHYRAKQQKLIEDEEKYVEEQAHQGRHTSKHSVEKTRRRLYVKVKLRRAAAYENLANGNDHALLCAARAEINDALGFEPTNADALDRLQRLQPRVNGNHEKVAVNGDMCEATVSARSIDAPEQSRAQDREAAADVEEDDGEADCSALLESARGYISKEDFGGAFQILSYALKKDAFREDTEKVKCMINACLCLQKMRGRVEDMVGMCSRTLDVISDMQSDDVAMLRMECACYSRRGWGYSQMGRSVEAERDAEKVQYLLQRVES